MIHMKINFPTKRRINVGKEIKCFDFEKIFSRCSIIYAYYRQKQQYFQPVFLLVICFNEFFDRSTETLLPSLLFTHSI